MRDRNLELFQKFYHAGAEPWEYSKRAIEQLRHDRIVEIVEALNPRRLLEIGCSLGMLTRRLPGQVTAIDLSALAVQRANGDAAASVLALPFADASFDLVLASDGPNSWFLTDDELQVAFGEMHRVVQPGGGVLIADYEKPRAMDRFVERIERSPLQIQDVSYIHDRIWYKVERALPFIRGSRALASVVTRTSRIAGRMTANHIIVRTSRAAQ